MFIYILVFISIRFFTLLEEKVLCVFHLCKGPIYVGYGGILQPFSYALGLLRRFIVYSKPKFIKLFLYTPYLRLIIRILLWSCAPLPNLNNLTSKRGFFFFIIVGLSIFPILILGWGSNNKYRHIGAIRSVAQIISYELRFRFFFLILFFIISRARFKSFYSGIGLLGRLIFGPVIVLVFILFLAERNRRPFDFSESPSELVRGFITEYSGPGFVVLFIREYLSIIFMGLIFVVIFFNFSLFFFGTLISLVCFFYIWLRGTIIRFRYDIIIDLS